MIISRGRKSLFVHIPKTGGTALALALEARAMKDDIMTGDTPKALKRRRRLKDVQTSGRLWKHSGLADIEGLVSAQEIQDFFTFTLVRNPWDRAVSYYHWLRGQSFDHAAVMLSKVLTFNEFIAHPQTQTSFRANPYHRYMTMRSGLEKCDLYIRLEHFADDAQPLFQHLGFSLELARINSSERDPDYRRYYCEESAAIVAECSAADIKKFGYSY
ncbi:sulfotransferase family 2 domain-containing protein [Cognatishimia sp. WU-CL00825]|uniref:sulfotransferase family 2 domain-containing protein n=1 Tax=Cognatishimia sp. WU-CL00825 TaxID=3127658 RepID=UPI0031045C37